MKKGIRFAVNNPVTILMGVLVILLLGKISYDQLSVDLLPDLNSPRLFIEMKAGEQPPEEIEKQFIKNMEALVVRQSDVTEVSSLIKTGCARITAIYKWGKDMDEAFLDLQKAMNLYIQNTEITDLRITRHDPNAAPVLLLALSNETLADRTELRKTAENYIRNELIRLDGVADVTLSGEEVTRLTIRTDSYKLDAFRLTLDDIASKIEANNRHISGGQVSEAGLRYLVKSATVFTSESDFENLIVGYRSVQWGPAGTSSSGTDKNTVTGSGMKVPVFLKDVATVRFESARPENIVRINGKRCIGLSIYKETRFNTVKTVEAITKELGVLQQALPGYRFSIISDQGAFIQNSIGEVKSTLLLGVALAVIILFVFLRRIGTTLVVSIAIPISIVATFNLMFFNGLTLNIMTLGGLALGAGMLVDNAIVVVESIFRNQEKGLTTGEAAVTGTAEVGGAIIASTLTTIVVFLPIVYLHGASGELFKDQAWTVTFSLVSSLFVAIFVIPVLYNRIFRKKTSFQEIKPIRLTGYGNLLRKLIKSRWIVIGGALLLIFTTAVLFPHIGTEFMPRTDSRSFSIRIKLPEGARLEKTDATVRNLEELLYTIAGDSCCSIYSHTGPTGNSANALWEGENTATIRVTLLPKCLVSPQAVVSRFAEATDNLPGVELTIGQEENSLNSLLGSEETPITVEIKGEELEELAAVAEEVQRRMVSIDGLYNIVSNMEDGAPQLTVSLNRTLAGINQLTVSSVIDQIKQQLTGKTAGKMEYRGEMRDILLQMPEVGLSQLSSLVIKNGEKQFLLQEIAEIKPSVAPREIFHRNQNRISKIQAGLTTGKSLDKVAEAIRMAVKDIPLPPNYAITVTGEEIRRQESIQSLLFALGLSILLVYMVLASQFESLLHPFTILLTIPLAVVGALLLFFITGTTLNMMGIIGIVMLVGIAVNNSILLVDRINQLKSNGMELTEAIVQAGQHRIRPILMTSLTTILALAPMLSGSSDGSSLRSAMAIAVIGGLATSTLMSLMVIPCVYYVLEQAKRNLIKK